MGADQSSSRSYENRAREDIRTREFSKEQVAALLEKQRRFFEEKVNAAQAQANSQAQTIAQVQAAAAQAQAVAAQAQAAAQVQAATQAQAQAAAHAQAATQARNAAQALAATRAQIAARTQAQIAAQTQATAQEQATRQSLAGQVQGVRAQTPHTNHQATNNANLERERNPYTSNNLQQNVNAITPRPLLYPNLRHHENYCLLASCTGNQPNRIPNNNQARSSSARETGDDFLHIAPSAPRDRSVSRSRPRNNNEDKDVSCPTCRNHYGTRIFQCPSGHSSCNECKSRNARCGICHQLITDMRNITLEGYVSEKKVGCPNTVSGCRLFIKNAEMEAHLKECPFGDINCPLNNGYKPCNWKGKLNHLSSHFKENHPDCAQGDVDTEMLMLNICSDQKLLHFVKVGNFNFLFHVKVYESERKVCMAAQLIGTQMSAGKWNYEVHIYNKREPRRKHQFHDICTSSTVPIQEIFNDSKCVNLTLPYALTFYNEGCLAYKFFIKKINDGPMRNDLGNNRDNFGNNRRGRGGARRNV